MFSEYLIKHLGIMSAALHRAGLDRHANELERFMHRMNSYAAMGEVDRSALVSQIARYLSSLAPDLSSISVEAPTGGPPEPRATQQIPRRRAPNAEATRYPTRPASAAIWGEAFDDVDREFLAQVARRQSMEWQACGSVRAAQASEASSFRLDRSGRHAPLHCGQASYHGALHPLVARVSWP